MRELPEKIKALYPFENHYMETDGLRLHYVDEGKGEPVLMFHGNPTWSFFYRNLILRLREHFRCIVPDHMGCGLSDKPQDYPYCLAAHIENACRLTKYLGLKNFHLVAHDWGGPVGAGLAERKWEKTGKIVILNTAAFLSPRIPIRIRLCRWPVIGAVAVRGFNVFARGATRMTTVQPLPSEVRSGYLFPYDSWRNRVAILRFVQDIPLNPRHSSWPVLRQIERFLPALKEKPMLICWGMQDWCFGEHFLNQWRSRFPDAQVHLFPGAGHYLLEDAPDPVSRRIEEFLTR